MRKRRTLFTVLAVLLAAPLAAMGVCASLAPLVVPAAACAAETDPADCCSRSGAPASPRTPAPDRCAACGAAACAQLAKEREDALSSRRARPTEVVARPAAVRAQARTHRATSLVILAESPPKNVLLATFRN